MSTSAVNTRILKQIILVIKSKLHSHVNLPKYHIKNLRELYRFLTWANVIDMDRIMIIILLPLLDAKSEFKIYKVIAAPFSIQHVLGVKSVK